MKELVEVLVLYKYNAKKELQILQDIKKDPLDAATADITISCINDMISNKETEISNYDTILDLVLKPIISF